MSQELNLQHENACDENKNDIQQKKKEGFVKSPREVEIALFGPNSPLPDKWRVFNFIKYRIQDNKRLNESEHMSREFIIQNTGICEKNFNRIIKDLEKDKLIQVDRRNYRDSVAVYRLSTERFKVSPIVLDKKDRPKPRFKIVIAVDDAGDSPVDNFESHVDNSKNLENRNFKMTPESDDKLQNDATKLQNDVETVVTPTESLENFPLRSLLLDPLNLKPRALEENTGSFSSFSNLNRGRGREYKDPTLEELEKRKALLLKQAEELREQEQMRKSS